jgi:hypothetical protein
MKPYQPLSETDLNLIHYVALRLHDIRLLAERLVDVTNWVINETVSSQMLADCFCINIGEAALIAAADLQRFSVE